MAIITLLRQIRNFFPLIIFSVIPLQSYGQQTPFYPVSYRIINPFVFNPAIAGSKDFASADLIINNYGNSSSQIASANARLSKSSKEYLSSIETPVFSNIGVGAYLFNDKTDLTRNIGVGATGSYHLQLDKKGLSYISAGVSIKAIFNNYEEDPDLNTYSGNTFFSNLDAGIYYYSPSFYAGISATNLLGTPESHDTLGIYNIPVSRQYFLTAGYKLILGTPQNLMLEPFIIVNSGDSLPENIIDIIKPGLKMYAGDFCIGTYFNDFNKISFFAQFKYKKAQLGTYFELPYNSPYYKEPIIVEFAFGVNLSAIKSGLPRRNHW